MTNEAYSAAQRDLILAARMLEKHDWTAFLNSISACHSSAPILDPTLYRRGMGRLQVIQRMAERGRELAREVEHLRDLVIDEEITRQTEAVS